MGKQRRIATSENSYFARLLVSFSLAAFVVATIGAIVRMTWPRHAGVIEGKALVALKDHSEPLLTKFFLCVTWLGNTEALLVVLPLLGVLCVRLARPRAFTHLILASTSGGAALTMFLKYTFERSRPAMWLIEVPGYSFPSGHSTISLCLWGSVAYLLLRSDLSLWQKRLGVTLCGGLILAIGLSRVYLGVHYPSDVAAGYIAGGIWLYGCAKAYAHYRNESKGQYNLI